MSILAVSLYILFVTAMKRNAEGELSSSDHTSRRTSNTRTRSNKNEEHDYNFEVDAQDWPIRINWLFVDRASQACKILYGHKKLYPQSPDIDADSGPGAFSLKYMMEPFNVSQGPDRSLFEFSCRVRTPAIGQDRVKWEAMRSFVAQKNIDQLEQVVPGSQKYVTWRASCIPPKVVSLEIATFHEDVFCVFESDLHTEGGKIEDTQDKNTDDLEHTRRDNLIGTVPYISLSMSELRRQ